MRTRCQARGEKVLQIHHRLLLRGLGGREDLDSPVWLPRKIYLPLWGDHVEAEKHQGFDLNYLNLQLIGMSVTNLPCCSHTMRGMVMSACSEPRLRKRHKHRRRPSSCGCFQLPSEPSCVSLSLVQRFTVARLSLSISI